MAWQLFGSLAAGNQSTALFDTLAGQIAINVIVKCDAAGTNAVALTPNAAAGPPVTVYTTQQHFSFIAAASSSAAVTINVAGLGALKAFGPDATSQLGSGGIVSGREYVFGYNSALDTGAGGFQLISSTLSGAMVLIDTQTASASASLTFVTGITSAYKAYQFVLTDLIPSTSGDALVGEVSFDGGGTWETGTGYQYATSAINTIGGSGFINGTGTSFLLFATSLHNSANAGLDGTIMMFNPANSASIKNFATDITWLTTSAPTRNFGMACLVTPLTPINGVRFKSSNGAAVLTSGRIALFGIP